MRRKCSRLLLPHNSSHSDRSNQHLLRRRSNNPMVSRLTRRRNTGNSHLHNRRRLRRSSHTHSRRSKCRDRSSRHHNRQTRSSPLPRRRNHRHRLLLRVPSCRLLNNMRSPLLRSRL